MITLIFKRIKRDNYPKTVQQWSWTALFASPVFAIGNKLWFLLIIDLSIILFSLIILIFQLYSLLLITLYLVIYAISLFYIIFSIMYGRILAWDKFSYQNNKDDIEKFKKKQQRILIWSIIYYVLLTIGQFINIYLTMS